MYRALLCCFATLFLGVSFLSAQQIHGDYIESRSTDVYVAQCFANGEAGLTGNQALLAWHVQEGSWNGVRLDGLTVAAAVRARATLGDPYGDPYPAIAVLMVDDAANAAQRQALVALAKHQAGKLLENVARVDYVPVILDVPADPQEGHAVLRAGHLATIITRPLNHHDHICGNETNYYSPLTAVDHATSAVALTDEFQGEGLDSRWDSHGKRSAYIAHFSAKGPLLRRSRMGWLCITAASRHSCCGSWSLSAACEAMLFQNHDLIRVP